MNFSGPMLDLARRRLGDDQRMTYQEADYLTEPLPDGLCAIVSALSIHHLDDAGKQAIFARLMPR